MICVDDQQEILDRMGEFKFNGRAGLLLELFDGKIEVFVEGRLNAEELRALADAIDPNGARCTACDGPVRRKRISGRVNL